jgi:TrmH family RNA methyltransferase
MESISIRTLKIFSSLYLKKYRQKYQLFAVEGNKIAGEIIADYPHIIDSIIISDTNHEEKLYAFSGKIYTATATEIKQISQMVTPPGMICICKMAEYLNLVKPKKTASGWKLMLDGINDPGNLGTIVRTADWFGIREVLLINDCVDPFHPKFLQASMGSFLRVSCTEISQKDIPSFNLPVYGATMAGVSMYEIKLPHAGILLMGSESHGISPELMNILQDQVAIPAPPEGKLESLNVSVATGILLSHFIRPFA